MLKTQAKNILSRYRQGHMLKILETFDREHSEFGNNVPIDLHLRKYFLKNKSVTNIDREFVNNEICNMIRYRTLLDFCTKPPVTWHTRMDYFYSDNFEKQLTNVNLPEYLNVNNLGILGLAFRKTYTTL
jgi:hypothetical protein